VYELFNPHCRTSNISIPQFIFYLLGAVFDGHGGWQVSNFISDYLIMELNNQISNHHLNLQDDMMSTLEEIDLNDILVKAFQNTENEIIRRVKHAFQLGMLYVYG
jgi:serine/threonine protein phosphatase PrpC